MVLITTVCFYTFSIFVIVSLLYSIRSYNIVCRMIDVTPVLIHFFFLVPYKGVHICEADRSTKKKKKKQKEKIIRPKRVRHLSNKQIYWKTSYNLRCI